jgi:hypothetical protein
MVVVAGVTPTGLAMADDHPDVFDVQRIVEDTVGVPETVILSMAQYLSVVAEYLNRI